RQEELQADIGKIEAGRRRRSVVEYVQVKIGVWMTGFGAAGDARVEHRTRHCVGFGQPGDAAGSSDLPESRAAGVEEPHRTIERIEIETNCEAGQSRRGRSEIGYSLGQRHR